MQGPAVPLGPGDDCAVVDVRAPMAVTTDAIFENVHFRRTHATPEQIGHKALAVNLSDLAAAGARPVAFLCAAALPPDYPEQDVSGLARGMGRLAARTGAILAGGNLTRADALSLTITAMGTLEGEGLRRDRARPGDRILLVGPVGEAAAELRLLEAGGRLPPGRSVLLEPEPRLREGLAATGRARCAIDVSDGLVQDLSHVAEASGVGVRVDFTALPRSVRFTELTRGLAPHEAATLQLSGGEDYALVVVAPPAQASELAGEIGAVDIGCIEPGAGVVVDGAPDGACLAGWDHFDSPS